MYPHLMESPRYMQQESGTTSKLAALKPKVSTWWATRTSYGIPQGCKSYVLSCFDVVYPDSQVYSWSLVRPQKLKPRVPHALTYGPEALNPRSAKPLNPKPRSPEANVC